MPCTDERDENYFAEHRATWSDCWSGALLSIVCASSFVLLSTVQRGCTGSAPEENVLRGKVTVIEAHGVRSVSIGRARMRRLPR